MGRTVGVDGALVGDVGIDGGPVEDLEEKRLFFWSRAEDCTF